MRIWFRLGCIQAFLAIALGAFGAHALKDRLDEDMLAVYHTGVLYHLVHALALILVALAAGKLGSSRALLWSGRLMMTGIILFSGSLYVLSISGIKPLGAITPFGGVAFLTAWVLLAVSGAKLPK